MAKHVPLRLCIGCRTREPIKNLVRIAFDQADDSRSLVFDQRHVLPGRGAWLHRTPECFFAAVRKRAFARAFRGRVDIEQLEVACNAWQAETRPHINNDESGSEI